MKELALRYLERGWSVLPADRMTKRPLVKWEEFQTRLPTPDEVNLWFTKWPDANVGAVTGKVSNITVLDHDILELPVPVVSRIAAVSGSGGRHYFFRYNPIPNTSSRKNATSNKEALGYDFRNDGGFIVLAPSIHESGGRYRWLRGFTGELPVLPDDVATAYMQPTAVQQRTVPQEDWMIKAIQDLSEGHVHNTLVSVLGKFRSHNFSEEATFKFLEPHCLANGKPFDGLKSKISEIFARYEPKVSISVENEDAESVEDLFKVDEEQEWIIPGILAKNSIAMVVGLPESQKTWAAMDLAIESSRGGDWLGLFPVKPVKTLFVEQERDRKESKRRFKQLINHKGIVTLANLCFKLGSTIKINLDNSYQGFIRLLERTRPELVIIDSFISFHTKAMKDEGDMQSVMDRIKNLRSQFNCTFLFVHHDSKLAFLAAQEGREPGMNEMMGSIAISASCESLFTIQKTKGGGSIVYHTKSTLAKKSQPFAFTVEDVGENIIVRGTK